MKKKLFASICSFVFAFSLLSSFIVAEAATPEVSYIFDFKDTGTKLDENIDDAYDYYDLHGVAELYEITLTVKGASAKTPVKDESGKLVAFSGAWIQGIEGVAARYTTSKELVFIKTTKNWTNGTAVAGNDASKNKIAYSWGAPADSECIKADNTVLATWTVFAKDGSDITDIKIAAHEDAKLNTVFNSVWDGVTKDAETNVKATSNEIVGYPAASTTPAVAGKAIEDGFKTFSTDAAIEFAVGATPTIEISKSGTTDKLTETLKSDVIGEGKTKIIPIVSYKIGRNGVAGGDIFTIKVTNGTDTSSWTYTVPAE